MSDDSSAVEQVVLPHVTRTRSLPPAAVILFGAFCAAAAFAVCAGFECPPLADYIEWMYQGYIVQYIVAGHVDAPFYLRDYPVPYAASQLLLAALGWMFGPLAAGRALVFIYLGAGVGLAVAFVRRHALQPAVALPVLASAIVLSSSFFSGYINYQLGTLVLLAYLALPERRADDPVFVASLALAAFTCHAFTLLALCLIVCSRALVRGRAELLRAALALVPALGLLAWYVLTRSADGMALPEAPVAYASPKFFAYKLYTLTKAGPYHNFWLDGQGDFQRTPRLYMAGVAANVAFGGMLVAAAYAFVRKRREPAARSLGFAVIVLGAAYLLAPAQALGVVNPGERLLYPLLLCLFVVALARDTTKNTKRAWLVGGVTYSVLAGSLLSLATLGPSAHASPAATASVADPGFQKLLYWHRPLQFAARCTELNQAAVAKRSPSRKLAFPTSILADRD